MITADAMHTQRDHAEFLVTEKKAHYILVVLNNHLSRRRHAIMTLAKTFAAQSSMSWVCEAPGWVMVGWPVRGAAIGL